jgi:hypothetical protein
VAIALDEKTSNETVNELIIGNQDFLIYIKTDNLI